MILTTLEKYDIQLEIVLLAVTDNATNMVKVMKLLKQASPKEVTKSYLPLYRRHINECQEYMRNSSTFLCRFLVQIEE